MRSELPGSRILDIGASPFYFLYRAQAAGASKSFGIYFANDEHPLKHSDRIYSKYGPIELRHSNIETDNLPFPDNSLDIVTACEVFEHLEFFPTRLLGELRRVIRPGGLLCITVPNVSSVGNILKLIFQKNIYMRYRSDPTGRHKHEYTMAQLKALFEFLRMDIVRSGVLPSPTSNKRWLRPAYRLIAATPGIRSYSPAIYVVGRQPQPKPNDELKAPPKILYDDALSIED